MQVLQDFFNLLNTLIELLKVAIPCIIGVAIFVSVLWVIGFIYKFYANIVHQRENTAMLRERTNMYRLRNRTFEERHEQNMFISQQDMELRQNYYAENSRRWNMRFLHEIGKLDHTDLKQSKVREEGNAQLPERSSVVDQGIPMFDKRNMPDAAEMFGMVELGDNRVCFGLNTYGEPVEYEWKHVLSVIILGLPGGGKTNTAMFIISQLLLSNTRIALLDKHSRLEGSLHDMLSKFSDLYISPVGDTVESSLSVISKVKKIFNERLLTGNTPFRLLLAVDEFSAIMRNYQDKKSVWYKVAVALKNIVEAINMEGRKLEIQVVAVGQITNAASYAGTSIRDLFNTRVIHAMQKKQVQTLSMLDDTSTVNQLGIGDILLDVEGSSEPFIVHVPMVTSAYIALIKLHISSVSTSEPLEPENVPNVNSSDTEPSIEPPTNGPVEPTEPLYIENSTDNLLSDLSPIYKRVLELYREGKGKAEIIRHVWSATKGGGPKYRQAEQEYAEILTALRSESLL